MDKIMDIINLIKKPNFILKISCYKCYFNSFKMYHKMLKFLIFNYCSAKCIYLYNG